MSSGHLAFGSICQQDTIDSVSIVVLPSSSGLETHRCSAEIACFLHARPCRMIMKAGDSFVLSSVCAIEATSLCHAMAQLHHKH